MLLMLPLLVKSIYELNAGEYRYGNVHKTTLLLKIVGCLRAFLGAVGVLCKILLLRGVSSLLFTRALNGVIATS